MAKPPYPVRIRIRIDEIDRQMALLTAERSELETAARVLARLSDDDAQADDAPAIRTAMGSGRDTIRDSILSYLAGGGPSETADVCNHLRVTRPNVSPTTVSSVLSRMRASNEIGRDGKRWVLAGAMAAANANGSGDPEPSASLIESGEEPGTLAGDWLEPLNHERKAGGT